MNIVVIFATQPEIWYDGSTYWWKSARSERIYIPFAKKAMGPVLLDNVPIRSSFFISLRLKERIVPNSRQTFI
jgi:hypothetical protein